MMHPTFPHSLKDSNVSPKVKAVRKKGIGVRSLTCSISKVKGHAGMGTRMNDKKVNYSHGLTQTKQQVG
jgi:hypothetical protein